MRCVYLALSIFLLCGGLAAAADNEFGDDRGEAPDGLLPPEMDMEPIEPELDMDTSSDPKEFSPLEYEASLPKGKYLLAEPFLAPGQPPARWVASHAKKDGVDENLAKYDGRWEVSRPDTVLMTNDFMLKVLDKAKHHAISTKLDRPFHFDGRTLVVQYDVQFQQGQECGGGYIKLLAKTDNLDLKQFSDKTPYTIMFGPDKCGADAKLHFIIRYENPVNHTVNEHHSKKIDIGETVFSDHKSHLFTLVVQPDGGYQVLVDQSSKISANLNTDLLPPVQPAKEIFDPNDRKPDDWDEREKIPDPQATKPDDWDENAPEYIEDASATKPEDWDESLSELIPDPDATKPNDWDVEMDGEWEAPKIKNPACEGLSGCGEWQRPQVKNPQYNGKWHAPMVTNPDYKGKWQPRSVPNPHWFQADPYKMGSIAAVGIELWTMSSGILFDNVLVTDDKAIADQWASDTWAVKVQQDKLQRQGKGVTGAMTGALWGLVEAANERPWLWAIYLVAVLLPIVLIAVFCFGAKSEDESAGRRKKTDDAVPDAQGDAAPDEKSGSASGSGDEPEPEAQHDTQPQTSKPVLRQRRANNKQEMEQDESDSGSGSESGTAEGDNATAATGPAAAAKRRARARKD